MADQKRKLRKCKVCEDWQNSEACRYRDPGPPPDHVANTPEEWPGDPDKWFKPDWLSGAWRLKCGRTWLL